MGPRSSGGLRDMSPATEHDPWLRGWFIQHGDSSGAYLPDLSDDSAFKHGHGFHSEVLDDWMTRGPVLAGKVITLLAPQKTCWILRLRGSGGLAIWVPKVLAFADEFHPSKHAEVWDLRTPWYLWYCLIGSSGLRVSVFLFFLQQMRLYCILGAAGTTHVWAIAMFKWCFKTLSWYDTES